MNLTWSALVLHPTQTVREAIATIDSGGQKIALVVGEKNQLLGTVSDGDVRRAILRNVSLESSVREVMNPKPRSASPSTSRAEVVELMDGFAVDVIPVIDTDGILIGLEHRYPDRLRPRYENPVVIMAGGEGRRLMPLTEKTPKPMLPIGGVPILEIIIRKLHSLGFSNFILSLHYLGDQIREHFGDGSHFGVQITYVEEDRPLGTAGALRLIEPLPDCPVLLMNGDLLTTLRFDWMLEHHLAHGGSISVGVRSHDIAIPFGVVEIENGEVARLVEKPTHHIIVNAGVYVLDPSVIGHIEPDERIDMPDLIRRVLDRGGLVPVFPVREDWIDIGRPDDFMAAEQYLSRLSHTR